MNDLDTATNVMIFAPWVAWFVYGTLKLEAWMVGDLRHKELTEIQKLRADNASLVELHKNKTCAYLYYSYQGEQTK